MKFKIKALKFGRALLRLRDCPIKTPVLLWSRGWYSVVDWCGSGNFLYPAYPTRFRVLSLNRLIGKQGVIWLRLGSEPPKPEIDNGALGDLSTFARDVVGRLGGPSVLVTTDGDRSIPSGLPDETVAAILNDPDIIAWYTQNLDGSLIHSKLKCLPIGIDLHTRVGSCCSGPRQKASVFKQAIKKSLKPHQRVFRIWSDVHLEQDLGNMEIEFREEHGKPGAQLFETRGELRDGIQSGELTTVVDSPDGRLSLSEVWEKYGRYTFVMSLPGHGLDCHRTWEALALGAIIITIHSPIDELLRPYKVVFLDRHDSEWWKEMTRKDWLMDAHDIGSQGNILDLDWRSWITPIKKELSEYYV